MHIYIFIVFDINWTVKIDYVNNNILKNVVQAVIPLKKKTTLAVFFK